MTALTVLVAGATGSIGRHVVNEALAAGHTVRALVRSLDRGSVLPGAAQLVVGDVTRPETLAAPVSDVDAIVFTLGSDGQGAAGARTVDYEGVRNLLAALGGRPARIALMTAIGVTDREGQYNRTTQAQDWKRRSERLVRASGDEYTIVRPGWFDYNAADQHRLVFLQGDRRHAGTPADGVVARQQIAQVLVESLTTQAARHKTLELVAETGPAQSDLDPLFVALEADPDSSFDATRDTANMPLEQEPADVRSDLEAAARRGGRHPDAKGRQNGQVATHRRNRLHRPVARLRAAPSPNDAVKVIRAACDHAAERLRHRSGLPGNEPRRHHFLRRGDRGGACTRCATNALDGPGVATGDDVPAAVGARSSPVACGLWWNLNGIGDPGETRPRPVVYA